MKERKPRYVVGGIKVISFMGTKLNGLSYYGTLLEFLIFQTI